MSDKQQFSIIREQGEFMDPVDLNEKDNETVKREVNNQQDRENDHE